MPQVLRVVCCFQCRQFQSDIVKKSHKWTCNRCNTKQTLCKEYGRGSGLECRLLAQQLSTRTCETEDLLDRTLIERLLQDDDFEIPADDELEQVSEQRESHPGETTSKWSSFLAKDEPEEDGFGLLSDSPLPQSRTFHNPSLEPARKDLQLNNPIPEPTKSSPSWQPKRKDSGDPPTKIKPSIPLMNFHQMKKEDKKQFKWESRKTSNNSPKISPKSPEVENTPEVKLPTQGFFSFKPKVPTSLKRPPERVEEVLAMKQELVEGNEPVTGGVIGFNKMMKFDGENYGVCTNEHFNAIQTSQPTSSGSSVSKWSKFVVEQEEDDGIIRT